MTTATATLHNRMGTEQPGRSLEELVDRVIDALLASIGGKRERTVAQAVHDARRQRQAGDLDGALASLGSADIASSSANETRWAYGEWVSLAKRRFADRNALVYSAGTGRAAVLAPADSDGMLAVLAVLGMRWQPGQKVSRRSLRGLRPLTGGAS